MHQPRIPMQPKVWNPTKIYILQSEVLIVNEKSKYHIIILNSIQLFLC